MDTAKPERGERALAADIGGTNARFALAEVASGKVRLTFRRTYPTWSFPDFEPALQAFLSEARAAGAIGRDVPRAAVAIAGAVDRHAGRLTNRAHWTFDLHALRAQLGVRVRRLHLRRHRGEACRALRRR
jgi:glucokinase